ncbi:MAG TPA: hypothetical protein VF595_05745 [Tepidisphaeraceae bacterium]
MDDALRCPALPDPLAPPAFDRARVRRWAVLTAAIMLGAYLLLQNPYWVPGGDSDFYVSVARSMARGEGFRYNGQPVAISPPGWPWVMAQVMKITPTFTALKLTAMLSMYGSLLVGYFIALRFLRPSAAATATVLAALLMPVYSLTYFLHSEGVYCLLSAVALLLAFRLREGRGGRVHVAALLALCVTLPLVRWAGIFQLAPIAAVLISGPRGMAITQRHWKTAIACCLLIIGTWIGTRQVLSLTQEEQAAVAEVGGDAGGDVDITEQPSEVKNVDILTLPKDAKHGMVREYFNRTVKSGKWFSWLLWQPTRFVQISRPADFLVGVVGWGVIVMLGYLAVVEARRGEWLWVSLALYTGGICLNWDNVNSRYFVPVAPLIIVGLLLATRRLGSAYPLPTFDLWKWLRRGLVYSILLCNLAMFGVDVIVMRSNRFYETFEAGQHKDLIAAARFLMSLSPQPPVPATMPATMTAATQTTRPASQPTIAYRPENGDVLVNERYENLGRPKSSKAGSRAMVLLTDRYIRPLDGKVTRVVRPPPKINALTKIMRARKTEWYFAQAPAVPWRLWHFRVPDWLYRRLSNDDAQTPSGGWALYYFDRNTSTFTQYPFPPAENWPTRVPGM